MADLVETNLTKFTSWRRRWMTKTVTYRRGGESHSLLATLGRSDETQEGETLVMTISHRDFIIETTDMAEAGLGTPQVGDRIVANFGPTAKTFEVLSRSGTPAWRYTDSYQRVMRIHTKEVES